MSKRHYDDDSEDIDVRPGDIGDLFEDSELDVNETDMDVDESVETDDSTEDWNEYMVNDEPETTPIMESSEEEQPKKQESWVEHCEKQIQAAEAETPMSDETVDAIIAICSEEEPKEESKAEKVMDDFIERQDEIAKDPELSDEEILDMINKKPSEEVQAMFDKLEGDNLSEATVEEKQKTDQEIIDELLESSSSETEPAPETDADKVEDDSIDQIIEEEEQKELETPVEETSEPEIEADELDEVMDSTEETTAEIKEEENGLETEGRDGTSGENNTSGTTPEDGSSEEDDEIEVLEENTDFENVKDDSDEERLTRQESDIDRIIKGPHESIEKDEYDLNRNQHFKYRVKSIIEKFPPAKISEWLNQAKEGGESELDVLKDFYLKEFAFYNGHINFENPNAKADLWTIVAYDYFRLISCRNATAEGTYVESIGRADGMTGDGTLIENEYTRDVKERKKSLEEKYRKYKLDRTFFDISEDESECSIFEVRKSLMDEFVTSVFYRIHKEVLESDEVFDMTKVRSRIIKNEQTHAIPIIDYSTGVRCICVNTSDVNQYHMNVMAMARKIPFSFTLRHGEVMRVRVLYSDDCLSRSVSIVSMLKKLVGFRYMNKRFITTLHKNFVMAYTTEAQYVNMFEYGDPDTKDAGNSTYNKPKTNNMCVGIIVLDKKTEKDRQSMRRNQFRDDTRGNMLGGEDVSAFDYNAHFVLSARIIRNDLRLRDPSYMKNERYVEYTIVSLTESNAVVINDALPAICAAIIKEHKKRYDPGTNYAISFELDRDNFVSPSIVDMIDRRDGIELSNARRINGPTAIAHQFILPPSRLKMSGVYDFEKGRLDARSFSPFTIQHNYAERSLWQNYDINTQQGRIEFLKSRGFEDFFTPAPLTYDVLPYVLDMLETGEMCRDLINISVAMLRDKNSEDSENLLFKQRELNYLKGLDEDGKPFSKFQRFMFSVIDFFVSGGEG